MTESSRLLNASSRVAFAALMHDLGKFAERAALSNIDRDRLDAHLTQYCPFREHRYHSHRHAAWTALMLDQIESFAPDLISKDPHPFASRDAHAKDITDSLVNAASMHHKPDSFLQWIIATADRLASGFEREEFDKYNAADEQNESGRNHYQARQLTLFEQIRLKDSPPQHTTAKGLLWRYPLKALSAEALFPVRRQDYEPTQDAPAQAEYRHLWEHFLESLKAIPATHRQQWPLWLDHFDTAWQCFTQAIPSATAFGTKPEVSLYDHSKTTAALATALWRWHHAHAHEGQAATDALKTRADWDEQKLLLIQGDFFGIQDFIFADGAQTNKNAARLLRGRSFQVSLFTELAALKVLEACALPPTSQIINAAGKFLIVAPNTAETRQKLESVRTELDAWFLQHSFGLAGLGLVDQAASCNDFLKGRFRGLMTKLFTNLEDAKLKRFDLTQGEAIFDASYSQGICPYNDRLPADLRQSAALSRDQIKLGTQLARQDRLLIATPDADLQGSSVITLETPLFGYQVGFTGNEGATGRFGRLAQEGQLRRCWDFSLPEALDAPLWHGYARRYINAYVPRFAEVNAWSADRYGQLANDPDFQIAPGEPKSLNHLACEDRQPRTDHESWQGQVALTTLKGDVDNLGQIFQKGLTEPTFAKMAALSRQINAFFAIWLPAYCATHYPNTYTIFAGGDDFFLIGPWYSTQKLAGDMATHFKAFVADNPEIHFSAGMVMSKPGLPIHTLATQADEALEAAKGKGKNAVTLFQQHVPWSEWSALEHAGKSLNDLAVDYKLSTGYVYGLLHLIDLASDSQNPESAMWRSRFAYRTRRHVVDKLKSEARNTAQTRLAHTLGEAGIAQFKGKYRIPVFNYFYRQR